MSTLSFADFPRTWPFFSLCERSSLAAVIRNSTRLFPFIETIHILALAVLLGTILLIDLRLLGLGIRTWSPARLAREVDRFVAPSLAVILITGFLLFLSEAKKTYDNEAFFVKMVFLVLAIAYHYTVHTRVERLETFPVPLWAKLLAVVSIGLWFGVVDRGPGHRIHLSLETSRKLLARRR